jgi:hypothetical protein
MSETLYERWLVAPGELSRPVVFRARHSAYWVADRLAGNQIAAFDTFEKAIAWVTSE